MTNVEKEQLSMWIINKLHKESHPLAEGINLTETDRLIENLRSRLSLSNSILDLTPSSLNILESSLEKYYHENIVDIHLLSEEEVITIIREICAYVGRTIADNTDGKWLNRGSLKGTVIDVPGPITGKKGKRKIVSESTLIRLWNIATVLWDNIVIEFKPSRSLYDEFLLAKNKKI